MSSGKTYILALRRKKMRTYQTYQNLIKQMSKKSRNKDFLRLCNGSLLVLRQPDDTLVIKDRGSLLSVLYPDGTHTLGAAEWTTSSTQNRRSRFNLVQPYSYQISGGGRAYLVRVYSAHMRISAKYPVLLFAPKMIEHFGIRFEDSYGAVAPAEMERLLGAIASLADRGENKDLAVSYVITNTTKFRRLLHAASNLLDAAAAYEMFNTPIPYKLYAATRFNDVLDDRLPEDVKLEVIQSGTATIRQRLREQAQEVKFGYVFQPVNTLYGRQKPIEIEEITKFYQSLIA